MVTPTVEVRIAGQVADPCRIALPLAIVHGRSTIDTQPDPPGATILWDGADCPYLLGDRVEIWAAAQYDVAVYDSATATYDDPSAVYDDDGSGEVLLPRFVGSVAERRADAALGQVSGWTLECIGGLARYGYRLIKTTRPQESDVARFQAIAAYTGASVRVDGQAGPLLAADTLDSDVLSAWQLVAASSGGLIWQDLDGTIVYGTGNHRLANPNPVGVLECEAIESTLGWAQTVEQIVNEVTVGWGPQNGGARGEVTHRDSASAAKAWGWRAVQADTVCAREADADQLGLLILARRAQPYWGIPDALVFTDRLTPDGLRLTARDLDVSVPVLVPISEDPGPTPSPLQTAVVEGFVEVWEPGAHTIQYSLSDQDRWVITTLRTWAEARTSTWAYWRPQSWLDMLVEEAA